jgi:hypothetical protein
MQKQTSDNQYYLGSYFLVNSLLQVSEVFLYLELADRRHSERAGRCQVGSGSNHGGQIIELYSVYWIIRDRDNSVYCSIRYTDDAVNSPYNFESPCRVPLDFVDLWRQ